MQRLFAYCTGALALLIVAASAASALIYAALHRSETLTNLGTSTLSGVGVAIGGCLGSALLLRFKAAPVRQVVIRDINKKTPDSPNSEARSSVNPFDFLRKVLTRFGLTRRTLETGFVQPPDAGDWQDMMQVTKAAGQGVVLLDERVHRLEQRHAPARVA